MENVASEFTFGNWIDVILRNFSAKERFEFKLLHLPLELLRPLLSLLFKDLDLPLHRGNLLFLLKHLELEAILGFLFCFVANTHKQLLDPLFDG